MCRSCQNKSGIFNSGIFQPKDKYGIFLGGEINFGIFHTRKINTVFIFALDSRWTAGGQNKWTEWTEVCPLGWKKVQ